MNSGDKNESQLSYDFHLSDDNLCDDARRKFAFHTDILNCLIFCGRNVLLNKNLTSAGRHILCSKLTQRYENVKSMLNYAALSLTEPKQKITDVPMIVICGLPRTGTTLLHNLMACDPAGRAPFITDMTMQPVPPISRSNITEHKRRINDETRVEEQMFEVAGYNMKQYAKERSASHANFVFEEDTILQEEVGVQCSLCMIAPKHMNMIMWFTNDKNKDFVYAYHRTVLQMLHNVDPPQTHWQVKSPFHALWLNTLLKYYPQASLIMCHRRLDEVFPSACRLFIAYSSVYFDENNSTMLKTMVEQTTILLDILIQRIIEFRTERPPLAYVYDIQYEDLMKDPIGTMRLIYKHFDFLQWSDGFEHAMHTWLVNNPQGKQGRHTYSKDQFGLVKSYTKELHKKYEKMFISD